jgi:murein DD-endopeptidase MepM/ murein hydrolase activator NlpD
MSEKKPRKEWKEKIRNPYRLVVMDDSSFEEKASFVISPLNLFVFIGSVTLFFIFLMTYIIAFTPLREYIPGYADVSMRNKLVKLAIRTDSIGQMLTARELYIANLEGLLEGKAKAAAADNEGRQPSGTYAELKVDASANDSSFREYVEQREKNSLASGYKGNIEGIASYFFFPPLSGMVSTSFRKLGEHFGVDIVAQNDEAVKATLSGTVVFTGWTVDQGYVIQLQHDNNLMSVYKHNSVLLRRQGEKVESGEAIAIVGNTGETSTGPHLHFELWYQGIPVDPQEYMRF